MLATMNEREYITVGEAAQRVGLSEMTVRRIIAAGFLHYRGKRQRTKFLDGNELESGLAAWRAAQTAIKPINEGRGGK